jgi:hypothetical protein
MKQLFDFPAIWAAAKALIVIVRTDSIWVPASLTFLLVSETFPLVYVLPNRTITGFLGVTVRPSPFFLPVYIWVKDLSESRARHCRPVMLLISDGDFPYSLQFFCFSIRLPGLFTLSVTKIIIHALAHLHRAAIGTDRQNKICN